MSTIETERFVGEMKAIWGSHLTPRGPRMGPQPIPWRDFAVASEFPRLVPDPIPWRELWIAYDLIKLADYLELATEGLGQSMISRFADEPRDPCGTRAPGVPLHPPHGGPPPPEEPIISLSLLGAALIFVGEGAGSATVREAAVAAGQKVLARE